MNRGYHKVQVEMDVGMGLKLIHSFERAIESQEDEVQFGTDVKESIDSFQSTFGSDN